MRTIDSLTPRCRTTADRGSVVTEYALLVAVISGTTMATATLIGDAIADTVMRNLTGLF